MVDTLHSTLQPKPHQSDITCRLRYDKIHWHIRQKSPWQPVSLFISISSWSAGSDSGTAAFLTHINCNLPCRRRTHICTENSQTISAFQPVTQQSHNSTWNVTNFTISAKKQTHMIV